jgi:hypothetical protein
MLRFDKPDIAGAVRGTLLPVAADVDLGFSASAVTARLGTVLVRLDEILQALLGADNALLSFERAPDGGMLASADLHRERPGRPLVTSNPPGPARHAERDITTQGGP